MSTKGNNVIAAIVRGELDDDIDAIQDAARVREKVVHRNRAATVRVGDRVRLTGIRPKALDGATGTVKSRRNTSLMVEIDKEFARGAGRFEFQIERGVPLGVPAACIGEVLPA